MSLGRAGKRALWRRVFVQNQSKDGSDVRGSIMCRSLRPPRPLFSKFLFTCRLAQFRLDVTSLYTFIYIKNINNRPGLWDFLVVPPRCITSCMIWQVASSDILIGNCRLLQLSSTKLSPTCLEVISISFKCVHVMFWYSPSLIRVTNIQSPVHVTSE